MSRAQKWIFIGFVECFTTTFLHTLLDKLGHEDEVGFERKARRH